MRKAVASLQTERASRYLQAMCKHFAHKVTVGYDARQGWAALPYGRLAMSVEGDDTLLFTVEAESAEMLERTKYVVDAHIVRFAFREQIKGLKWSDE